MTETKLPEKVEISVEGTRSMLKIRGVLPNALTGGKLDRNAIYTIGRHPETFELYTINADGKDVAHISRTDKQWTVHLLDENGQQVAMQKYDRSETKRPRRKGSSAPQVIDNGPDLFMVVTKVAHELWPEMKSTGRGTSGKRPTNLREKVEQQEREKMALLETLAKKMGKSIEDTAYDLGIEMPKKASA